MKKYLLFLLAILFAGQLAAQDKILSEDELQLYPTYRKLQKVPVDSVYKITIENLGPIPDDFDKWVRLQKLCLFGNDWDYDLYSLPGYFYSFPNLTHLSISNTEVPSLSSSIKNFTKLEYLNVANNKLLTLPKSMTALENLKTLVIDNNIDKIPAIPALEDLSIYFETNMGDDTGLIPEGIPELTTIKTLYLNGENTLIDLPAMIEDIRSLPALKKLSFIDPNLIEMDLKALSGIKKIEELDLPSIEVDPEVIAGFSHLKKFSFGKYLNKDQKVREQFWNTLKSFPKLEEVTTTFDISDTQYYRQIKSINLVLSLDTPLDVQMSALRDLPNLNRLEFPRTSVLPRNLGDLKTVREVDVTELYGIDISFIFGYLMSIPSLEKIIISNDQLTTFPQETVKFTHLKSMEIYNVQHGVFLPITEKEKARARKLLPDCKFWYNEAF